MSGDHPKALAAPGTGRVRDPKKTLSPFGSTELGWWLRKRGIDTIVLSGVVTHYVILATALSAYDLGFNVVVAKDCCMSGSKENHEVALNILKPISRLVEHAELMKALDRA